MMKLSEMMRLGSMQVPECHGPIYRYDLDGNVCGACAFGTLLFMQRDLGYPEMDLYRHPLVAKSAKHPACEGEMAHEGKVLDIIISLFETFRWTRPQIADWLETVEAQFEAEVNKQLVEVG